MNLVRRRVGAALFLSFIVLALFLLRPGANGLRKRIINSVSLSLGRKVDVQWVKLRLLPRPGFELVNFVVYDDPAFSAEPVLRAEEVTAALGFGSLLGGRMEIGRLSLKEPSLNLVRGANGRWNIESLIERAAHAEAVQAQNHLPARRPRFPYLEAENGRINFKVGPEKKSYALTDADFAVWLDSNDRWGMRLAAQPVRTDFNLTDTGTLRMSGTWQRSGSLRDIPLEFALRWDGAQMGELTKLFYGRDMGWRGGLTFSADLTGTPAQMKIGVKLSLDDFRRYDIVTQQSLRLATTCEANYSSVKRAISNLVCRSPIGQGSLSVKGRIGAPTGRRAYDLTLAVNDIPLQAVVNLMRRAKKDLPDDLSATGTVAGNFALRSAAKGRGELEWTGGGRAEHFVLHSAIANTELTLGMVPFGVQSVAGVARKNSDLVRGALSDVRLSVGPIAVPLAKQAAVTVEGWATGSGYNFTIQGEGPVERLLQAAQIAGLQVPQLTADGSAKVNLAVAGLWPGFAAPRPSGTVQLRPIRARLPGLNGEVDIDSANLLLDNDRVHVTGIVASAAGTNWEGSLSFPRPCHFLSGCPVHFDLEADRVAADRLQKWLGPANRKRPWYRFTAGTPGPSLLTVLNASGSLAVKQVHIRGVEANRISCDVEIRDGFVHLTGLTADLLGGKHRGNWTGNLRVSPPEFTAAGTFERIDLGQLADAMHDGWIAGTAKGTYQFRASGRTAEDWLASGKGALQYEMRDGILPHILIPSGGGPLRVRRFTGHLAFEDGAFVVEDGRLASGSGVYQVTGSALPGQKLEMKLARSGGSFLIEGTLPAPHIVPVNTPDTRASLKP